MQNLDLTSSRLRSGSLVWRGRIRSAQRESRSWQAVVRHLGRHRADHRLAEDVELRFHAIGSGTARILCRFAYQAWPRSRHHRAWCDDMGGLCADLAASRCSSRVLCGRLSRGIFASRGWSERACRRLRQHHPIAAACGAEPNGTEHCGGRCRYRVALGLLRGHPGTCPI